MSYGDIDPIETPAEETVVETPVHARTAVVFDADTDFGISLVARLHEAGLNTIPVADISSEAFTVGDLDTVVPARVDVVISAAVEPSMNALGAHMDKQTSLMSAVADKLHSGSALLLTMPAHMPRDERVAAWFTQGLTNLQSITGGHAVAAIDPASNGAVDAVLQAAGVPADAHDAHLYALAATVTSVLPEGTPNPVVDVDAAEVKAQQAAAAELVSQANVETANASKTLSETARQIQQAASELEATRTQINTATSELDALRAELRDVEDRLASSRNALVETEQNLAAAQQDAAELEPLTQAAREAKAERDEARTELNSLTSDLTQKIEENNSLTLQVASERARMNAASEAAASFEHQAANAEARLVHASAEAAEMITAAKATAAEIEFLAALKVEENETASANFLAQMAAEAQQNADELHAAAVSERKYASEDAARIVADAEDTAKNVTTAAQEHAEELRASAQRDAEDMAAAAARSREEAETARVNMLADAANRTAELIADAQRQHDELIAAAVERVQAISTTLVVEPADQVEEQPAPKKSWFRRR